MALHLEKDNNCKSGPNSFKNVCCMQTLRANISFGEKKHKRQNVQYDKKMHTLPGKSCSDSCWRSCSQMAAR